MRPAVDVVVPFFGSDPALDALIARLKELELRSGDTLVVVDNRPCVPTQQRIPEVVPAPEVQSSYYARNRGAELGCAPWLVFIDADVRPPSDLLDRYFDGDVDERTAVLAGGIRDVEPNAGSSLAAWYARLSRPVSDDNVWRPGFEYGQTGNLAVRRQAFEASGGFAEVRSGGDAELCLRLTRQGWQVARKPEALVEHYSRGSFPKLLRQHLRYGAGAEWVDALYPGFAPSRRGPRLLLDLARALVASTFALLRRDTGSALRHTVDWMCGAAFELGRRLPNAPGPFRAVLLSKLRAGHRVSR